MEKVMIICAHPDDEVFGVGGTISKYVSEGKKVFTLILSYGELALPWMLEEEVQKIRKAESLKAAEILGTHTTKFLGFKENKMGNLTEEELNKLKQEILKFSPDKIFTHVDDDPHINHRQVNRAVLSSLKEINFNGEVYGFDIWNAFDFKKTNVPKLYVDIRHHFKKKLTASKVFETQKIQGRWPLVPLLTARAVFFGFQKRCGLAERFRKLEF